MGSGGTEEVEKVKRKTSSYTELKAFCDLYFPPFVPERSRGSSSKQNAAVLEARTFSSANYWKADGDTGGFDLDAELKRMAVDAAAAKKKKK
jgi:hypothetical protein